MPPATERKLSAIAKRQLDLRDSLWPDLPEIWQKTKGGYTAMPRALPLVLQFMDELSVGKPLSGVYLDLWCRSFDENFITLNKHSEMAFTAGFSGQRATGTWMARVRKLRELGFIDVKPGPTGELSYAIIRNPFRVVEELRHRPEHKSEHADSIANTLLQRLIDVGAQ